MKPDPNYPRMMFHRSKDPVTVHSEEEEASLGAQWSRTIIAALPQEEKPVKVSEPEPDDEPEEEPEEESPEPGDEPVEEVEHAATEPPARPKRGRPAVHKPPHKTARKRT